MPTDPQDRLRGINAFVVEDREDVRVLYEKVLRAAGAVVVTAATPDAALQAAHLFLPDVVITDLTFGGLRRDGAWLKEQMRGVSAFDGTRIIALTGSQLDAAWRLAHDFDAVLTKPVDAEQLVALVEQLVRGRRRAVS